MSTASFADTAVPPFHLAFPVHDLDAARRFYGGVLGCPEGRGSAEWIDFNFCGHQIVAHLAPDACGPSQLDAVDGHGVPVRHFGVVLSIARWEALAGRLRAEGTALVIEPCIRFKGEVGEQATMFFLDPSGNAIEIKAFATMDSLFTNQATASHASSASGDFRHDGSGIERPHRAGLRRRRRTRRRDRTHAGA